MDYPSEFLDRMKPLLGDKFPAFLRALEAAPVFSLRLNPFKPIPFDGDAVPWEPLGRYVDQRLKPGKDLFHFAGAYYMQEASAMAPARALAPKPGDAVLDLCAAPGGKSGQLAAMLEGRGVLVANEPDARRARALSGNLERLGVKNAVVTNAHPEALSRTWAERFDKILVDAPCSGEGMMRRDETARGQWRPAQMEGCKKRQLAILHEASWMLKPGGRLAYSTCTFNEIENEAVVDAFLRAHPEFSPVDFTMPGAPRSKDGCLRLWPHEIRGEGHFVALLQKSGEARAAPPPAPPASQAEADALKRFLALVRPDESLLKNASPRLMGEVLSLVPNICPPLSGVRVLRAGLRLGMVRPGYLKPDHALAMALAPGEAAQSVSLSAEEAEAFVRGEALLIDHGCGYALAVYEGLPLGWGKLGGGALKNHIPKGVRI